MDTIIAQIYFKKSITLVKIRQFFVVGGVTRKEHAAVVSCVWHMWVGKRPTARI